MAHGLKYYAESATDAGTTLRVEIHVDGFVGTPSQRRLMGDGVLIHATGPDRRDVYKAVLPSTAEILLSDDDGSVEADILHASPRHAKIVVKEGSAVVWAGWVVPGIDTRSLNAVPESLSITARDGLQEMKDLPFVDANGDFFAGRLSAGEILRRCLVMTGLGLDILMSSEWYVPGIWDGDRPLDHYYFDAALLRGERGHPASVEDVFTAILEAFHLQARQSAGEWHVIDRASMFAGSYMRQRYDGSGQYLGRGPFNPAVPVAEEVARMLRLRTSRQPVMRAYGSFVAVYGHGEIPPLIRNGSFDYARSQEPTLPGVPRTPREPHAPRSPRTGRDDSRFAGRYNREEGASKSTSFWTDQSGAALSPTEHVVGGVGPEGQNALRSRAQFQTSGPNSSWWAVWAGQEGRIVRGGDNRRIRIDLATMVVRSQTFQAASGVPGTKAFWRLRLEGVGDSAGTNYDLDQDESWVQGDRRISVTGDASLITETWVRQGTVSDEIPSGTYRVRIYLYPAVTHLGSLTEPAIEHHYWTGIGVHIVDPAGAAPEAHVVTALTPASNNTHTGETEVRIGDGPLIDMPSSLTRADGVRPLGNWRRGAYGAQGEGAPLTGWTHTEMLARERWLEQAEHVEIHTSDYLREMPRCWPHQAYEIGGVRYQVGSVTYNLARRRQSGNYPRLRRATITPDIDALSEEATFSGFGSAGDAGTRAIIEMSQDRYNRAVQNAVARTSEVLARAARPGLPQTITALPVDELLTSIEAGDLLLVITPDGRDLQVEAAANVDEGAASIPIVPFEIDAPIDAPSGVYVRTADIHNLVIQTRDAIRMSIALQTVATVTQARDGQSVTSIPVTPLRIALKPGWTIRVRSAATGAEYAAVVAVGEEALAQTIRIEPAALTIASGDPVVLDEGSIIGEINVLADEVSASVKYGDVVSELTLDLEGLTLDGDIFRSKNWDGVYDPNTFAVTDPGTQGYAMTRRGDAVFNDIFARRYLTIDDADERYAHETDLSDYLPKTGGTLTGDLVFAGGGRLRGNDDALHVYDEGGTNHGVLTVGVLRVLDHVDSYQTDILEVEDQYIKVNRGQPHPDLNGGLIVERGAVDSYLEFDEGRERWGWRLGSDLNDGTFRAFVDESRQIRTNSVTGLSGGGNLGSDRDIGLTGQALSLHLASGTGVFKRSSSGVNVGLIVNDDITPSTIANNRLVNPHITLNAGTGIAAIGQIDLGGSSSITLSQRLQGVHGASNGILVGTTGGAASRTIQGTANQVIVSNGNGIGGNPVLSLPQDIHAGATPEFAGGRFNGLVKLYTPGQNDDAPVLRMGDRDQGYGFEWHYMGVATGNNNALELWADEQIGTPVRAMQVLQDGATTIDNTLTLGKQATSGSHALRADRTLRIQGTANRISVNNDAALNLTSNRAWQITAPQDLHTDADFLTKTLRTKDWAGSTSFASGWTGHGWRAEDDHLEVTDLTVRNRLRVYELLIEQIRANNGSVAISNAAEVASVSGSTITLDEGVPVPFVVGDILRAQRFTGEGVYVSMIRVTSVGSGSFGFTLLDGDAPAAGMEYVRVGNTTDTDRQGLVYLTASDSGAPYIDIIDGIDDHTKWNSSDVVRSRFGRLDGLTVPGFGQLEGYGGYIQRGYIDKEVIIGGAGLSIDSFQQRPTALWHFDGSLVDTISGATPDGYADATITDYGLVTGAGLVATLRQDGKFGGGVAVEEGTENIANVGWVPLRDNANSLIVSTGRKYLGQPVYRETKKTLSTPPSSVAPRFTVEPGETYTASVWIKHINEPSDATASLIFYDGTTLARSEADAIVGQWQHLVVTHTNQSSTPQEVNVYFYGARGIGNITEFSAPQVEQKPFATSFTEGFRAAGRLHVIPSRSGINVNDKWTIGLWTTPKRGIFDTNTSGTNRREKPLLEIGEYNRNGEAQITLRSGGSGVRQLSLLVHDNQTLIPHPSRHTFTDDEIDEPIFVALSYDGEQLHFDSWGRDSGYRRTSAPMALGSPIRDLLKLGTYGWTGNTNRENEYWGGVISEPVLFPYALSASEIRRIALSDAPIQERPSQVRITGEQILVGTDTLIRDGFIQSKYIAANSLTTEQLSFTPLLSAGGTGDIIATINATSEGLRIAANKIHIDGTTTFSSGYDPNEKATPNDIDDAIDAYDDTLGDLSKQDLVEKALLGETIIDGAYIRTDLLDVDTIFAAQASIGDWDIVSGNITSSGVTLNSDGYLDLASNAGISGTGTGSSSVRFWAGDSYSSRASAAFNVRHDGTLNATKANITGTINATGGVIGSHVIIGQYDPVIAALDSYRVYLGRSVLPLGGSQFASQPGLVVTGNNPNQYATFGLRFIGSNVIPSMRLQRDADNRIILNDASALVRMSSGGNDVLTVDEDGLKVTGEINATTGSIGPNIRMGETVTYAASGIGIGEYGSLATTGHRGFISFGTSANQFVRVGLARPEPAISPRPHIRIQDDANNYIEMASHRQFQYPMFRIVTGGQTIIRSTEVGMVLGGFNVGSSTIRGSGIRGAVQLTSDGRLTAWGTDDNLILDTGSGILRGANTYRVIDQSPNLKTYDSATWTDGFSTHFVPVEGDDYVVFAMRARMANASAVGRTRIIIQLLDGHSGVGDYEGGTVKTFAAGVTDSALMFMTGYLEVAIPEAWRGRLCRVTHQIHRFQGTGQIQIREIVAMVASKICYEQQFSNDWLGFTPEGTPPPVVTRNVTFQKFGLAQASPGTVTVSHSPANNGTTTTSFSGASTTKSFNNNDTITFTAPMHAEDTNTGLMLDFSHWVVDGQTYMGQSITRSITANTTIAMYFQRPGGDFRVE